QVGYMTYRRVFGVASRLDRPYHHLARVHPNTGFYRNLALVTQTLGAAPQLLLHRQRGMKCTLWMVLVSDRGTEQGEDAVTRRLRDVSAIAMHRLHHYAQHWIDNRARLFGIEIAHQFSRALDVGE